MKILETIVPKNRIIGKSSITSNKERKKKISFFSLSKSDRDLFLILLEDPLLSLVDLSEKLGISPQGIRKKIKRFEEEFIDAFTATINTSVLDRVHCIYAVEFKNHQIVENEMVDFLRKNRIFGRSFSTFGNAHAEITILPSSINELEEKVNLLSSTFSDKIRNFELLLVLNKTLESSVPWGLFDEDFIVCR